MPPYGGKNQFMSIKTKVLRELEVHPCRLGELTRRLGNNKKVQAALRELRSQGLVQEKAGLYALKQEQKPEGEPCVLVKLAETFGFAKRDDGKGDVFVPGRSLKGAMPGDKILVKLFDRPRVPGSMEGEVTAITEPNDQLVGTLLMLPGGRLAISPDRCPAVLIALRRGGTGGAKAGEKVAAAITKRGDRHSDHLAAVTVRFGSAESARQCAKAILFSHDVNPVFPDDVQAEAGAIPTGIAESEAAHRLDLRGEPIFTIDSAETKDIDDAVSLKATENGFELGVHIADVSYYVRPGTRLDEEAFARATSVYYASSVAPMLPKELSNGVCSLNEGEDRLAFSCLMKLDKQGRLQSYRFAKTLIRSRVKGVYKEINALLAGQAEECVALRYREVASQFAAMEQLYKKRVALREARSGMELETKEGKLILNDAGVCVGVECRERGLSECMIEEFMLLANECAANLGRTEKLPFVYRVHEEPDPDKVSTLVQMLAACGIAAKFKKAVPTQRELGLILDEVRGSKLETAVNTAVLRSMQKADYQPEPKGHFGLALEDYAHFTSPIRRYPDLSIHRIMSDWLAGVRGEELRRRYEKFAADASRQSSERELNALQTEREAEDCYKAEYLKSHLGEEFEGRVSGVTAKGLFVMLENTVEGFLPARLLCRGEPVLAEGVRLSDPLTGRTWMLGDAVRITVAKADVPSGKIDFAPAAPVQE